MTALVCAIGSHPIPATGRFYSEVVAWEKPHLSLSQSGSSLVLREPTGRIACADCITRLRNGLNPAQESLV